MHEDRELAWSKVKLAVRSYVKEPTTQHAEQVENAWRVIRRMDSLLRWRGWQAAKLNTSNTSAQSEQTE